MVNITAYQHVQSYRDLSFKQMRLLKQDGTRVYNHYLATADKGSLTQWEQVAYRIHVSLEAPRTLAQIFKDVITLQFVTRIYMQSFLGAKIRQFTILSGRKVTSDTPKIEIVTKLLEAFQNKLPALRQQVSVEVINEIETYLDDKLRLLASGRDVALPCWYHATQPQHLFPIMNGGELKQSTNGLQGPGTYFSTEDEHLGYGKYTFALDHDFVKVFNASYHEGAVSTKNYQYCVYLCAKQNITIRWGSVAHMIVDSQEDKAQLLLDIQQNLEDQALNLVCCPILTRKAADIIREIVKENYFYKFPFSWNPAGGMNFSHDVPYIYRDDILY